MSASATILRHGWLLLVWLGTCGGQCVSNPISPLRPTTITVSRASPHSTRNLNAVPQPRPQASGGPPGGWRLIVSTSASSNHFNYTLCSGKPLKLCAVTMHRRR